MKKPFLAPHRLAILTLSLAAVAPSAPAAAPAQAEAAEDAYYLGLYLQHARGDLDAARQAFEDSLAAAPQDAGGMREEALRRRAEIERLRGNPARAISTLAAAPPSPSADALGPARFFPPQMEVVGQVRLAELLASPLLQKFDVAKQIPAQELEKIAATLGFNPLKDIQRLTLAATIPEGSALALTLSGEDESRPPAKDRRRAGTASASAHLPLARLHFLIAAEGRFAGFKADKLIEAARAVKPDQVPVESLRLQGVAVSAVTIDDEGQKARLGLCRLDDSTLVLGDLQSLEEMLAARAGQKPGLSENPVLKALIEGVKPGAMVWLAAPAQRILDAAPELRRALKLGERPLSLRGFLLTTHFDRDLMVRATVSTEDAQSASLLSDIAKGAVALAQLAPVGDMLEKKIVSSLAAESSEREVTIRATIPGDLIREKAAAGDGEVSAIRIETRALVVEVGKSARLSFKSLGSAKVSRVVVEDPKVADVLMNGPDGFSITGVGPGETTVLVIHEDGKRTTVRVTTRP